MCSKCSSVDLLDLLLRMRDQNGLQSQTQRKANEKIPQLCWAQGFEDRWGELLAKQERAKPACLTQMPPAPGSKLKSFLSFHLTARRKSYGLEAANVMHLGSAAIPSLVQGPLTLLSCRRCNVQHATQGGGPPLHTQHLIITT